MEQEALNIVLHKNLQTCLEKQKRQPQEIYRTDEFALSVEYFGTKTKLTMMDIMQFFQQRTLTYQSETLIEEMKPIQEMAREMMPMVMTHMDTEYLGTLLVDRNDSDHEE